MRDAVSLVAATMVAATLLSGCQGETDVTQVPVRNTYSFQGRVDPRFVGEWHTVPAPSGLTLRKDGTAGIVAVATGQTGKTVTRLDGFWLASGNDLLIKYRGKGDSEDVVLKYSTKLSGNSLTMVQAGSGVKLTYKRAK